MSPILHGSKRIDAATKPKTGRRASQTVYAGHIMLTVEQAKQKGREQRAAEQDEWPVVPIVDPIPVPNGYSQESLLVEFGDSTLWLDQWLHELAANTRKLHRLEAKLADPALADSPYRPDAVIRRNDVINDQVAKACDVAWTEARCDRLWQAMQVETRESWASRWGVQPEADRLIGQAWKHIAGQEEWPEGTKAYSWWFGTTDAFLFEALKNASVFELDLQRNPQVAPF